jgi:hypothetical protein
MTQTLQPASVAAPRPELDWERDGNGRPRILPDPTWDDVTRQKWQAGRAWDDGTVGYTRVTTFAEALQDSSALTRWKMRRAVLGMGRRPDYVTAAAALSVRDEDRQALDDLAEKALEAAGPNAADVGTALHAFTERIDRGEELGPVPAEYQGTLDAYVTASRHLRFVDFECRTVCDDLEAAGTPDRVGFCDIPDPDGIVDELRIIDTKTGRVDYSAGKFSTQLAIYAHSAKYHPGTGARTSWEEAHGAPLSLRWGLVVHVPAGANTAELLWIDLQHGWTGAQHCALVRQWRTGAAGLLLPVFARPPRPATQDGTCRGRKQDGTACGYRRKTRAEGTAAQFCGRHGDQARDLERWWAENPGADPDGGVEDAPSREPVMVEQPAIPPQAQEEAAARSVAAQLARREQLAGEERCDTTGLLVTACACPAHRGGMTPEEEAAQDTGPACPWCSDTGCSVCQPDRDVLQESSTDVAAAAFARAAVSVAAQVPERLRELPPVPQGPVGTYALDPDTEQNGNRRPSSGLQTPEDAAAAGRDLLESIGDQVLAAQTETQLQTLYQRHAAVWTPWLTEAAGHRSRQLAEQQARERPEAALLAALDTAPDLSTLHRLFLAYGSGSLWTPEATAAAQARWEQLAGR